MLYAPSPLSTQSHFPTKSALQQTSLAPSVTPQSIIGQLNRVSGNSMGDRVNSHLALLNQLTGAMNTMSPTDRQVIQQKISDHYKANSYIGSAVTTRLNPQQRSLLLGAQQQVEFRPDLVTPIEMPEALALLKIVSAPIAAATVPDQTRKIIKADPREPSVTPVVTQAKAAHVHRAVTPVENLATLIQTTHEWADHVAIQATANAKKINIIVFDTRTQKISIIESATPSNNHVGVSYSGGHYQAVVDHGRTVEAMKIVGDCFYDSVAYGLNRQAGAKETAQSLRASAATELRTNSHSYAAFITAD